MPSVGLVLILIGLWLMLRATAGDLPQRILDGFAGAAVAG
jgi:hypothetical protein